MKNIDIGYFNFSKINNFELAQKNLDLFASKVEELEIIIPKFNFQNGESAYPEFSKVLKSRWKEKVVNGWQVIISEVEIASNEENKTRNSPYIQSVFQNIRHLNCENIPKLAIFQLDVGMPISGNSMLHGGSLNTIVNNFSIIGINQNYPELLFHELLHFFGAEEGYDTELLETYKNCSDCWMQFEPSKGHTLCQHHQTQVKSFLDSLSLS